MITTTFAEDFAKAWINSWNAHDIDAVLSHYADDFVIETPRALEVVPESNGIVVGKKAVRKYWLVSMEQRPNLQFQLLDLLIGINGISIYYLNAATNKRSVEVMNFNSDKKVNKAFVYHSK